MQDFFDSFYKWFVGPDIYFIDTDQYMFQMPHFLLVAIILSVTLLVFFLFRKKSYSTQRNVLLVIVWTIAICEIFNRASKLIWFADNGWLNWIEVARIIIPMHFCSIMVWIIIVSIVLDNRPMMDFSAIAGFIGTAIYMIYPIEGLNSSYFTIRALNSVLTHGLGFVGSTCLFLWGIAKFKLKDIWKTFAILIVIVLYGLLMNILIPGNNYMFMIYNPTPLDFGVIPYQLVLAAIVSTVVVAFYLIPFAYRKIKKRPAK